MIQYFYRFVHSKGHKIIVYVLIVAVHIEYIYTNRSFEENCLGEGNGRVRAMSSCGANVWIELRPYCQQRLLAIEFNNNIYGLTVLKGFGARRTGNVWYIRIIDIRSVSNCTVRGVRRTWANVALLYLSLNTWVNRRETCNDGWLRWRNAGTLDCITTGNSYCMYLQTAATLTNLRWRTQQQQTVCFGTIVVPMRLLPVGQSILSTCYSNTAQFVCYPIQIQWIEPMNGAIKSHVLFVK